MRHPLRGAGYYRVLIEGRDSSHQSWRESLCRPAPQGAAAGITSYLHWVWLGREDLQRAYPDLDGPDGPRFVEWAHLFGRHEIPIPEDLLPPRPAHIAARPTRLTAPAPPPGSFGVNVAGHLRGELGLGEAARLVVAALDAAGIPALPVDIGSANSFRAQHPFVAAEPGPLPFPVTIVCANPDSLWMLARRSGPELFEGRHTIGMWWWEALGGAPIEWIGPASLVDDVWCGSEFVGRAVAGLTAGAPSRMTLPVAVAPTGPPDRARFGLPDGFLFLFVYDHNSTLRRKNPAAVIEAFKLAFPPGSGAKLVLKSIGGATRPDSFAAVEAAAGGHPDIVAIDGWLDGAERHALTACCDCYVSLHRSEGFGLTLAEAMHLGKPVIATGFGGNLDFMTPDNSWLVDWEPVEVGAGAFPYPPHGHWADPSVEHAALLMRAAFSDPAATAARGLRAALDIRRTHSPAAAAASVSTLLEPVREAAEGAGRALPRGAAEAAAGVNPADVPALDRAGYLSEQGAEEAFRPRRSRLRASARRALLRGLRPLSAYQAALDRELIGALRETRDALRAAERRSLERDAAILTALRRADAALAVLDAERVAAVTPAEPVSTEPVAGVAQAALPPAESNGGTPP